MPKSLDTWMTELEDAVATTCEVERFRVEDRFPPGTRRWMVLTHRESGGRAMVWFATPDKTRGAPIAVTDTIVSHLAKGADITVDADDVIRMRSDPS